MWVRGGGGAGDCGRGGRKTSKKSGKISQGKRARGRAPWGGASDALLWLVGFGQRLLGSRQQTGTRAFMPPLDATQTIRNQSSQTHLSGRLSLGRGEAAGMGEPGRQGRLWGRLVVVLASDNPGHLPPPQKLGGQDQDLSAPANLAQARSTPLAGAYCGSGHP